jgi:hypothetical protein
MFMSNTTTTTSFAEDALGVKPPRGFILDTSVLNDLEEQEATRDYVRQNQIEYEFPDGFNRLDLLEECRALTTLDDFDVMYDLTMRMLTGKGVIVRIKNRNGTKTELCSFQIVDKSQDLRAITAIDEYPCIITWLTEIIVGTLLKKFPAPMNDTLPPEEPETKSGGKPKTPKAAT